jgi:glucosyl-dolichyl phosphate glucuronosyltransferase
LAHLISGAEQPEAGAAAGPVLPVAGEHRDALQVSVVVCAYTELRWAQTRAALASVLRQDPAPAQVLLVVDHNPGLAARARGELAADMREVTVLESDEEPGLSGARNCGLRAAAGTVTAFLDDDAEARTGWLAALTAPYSRGDVVASGGGVHPRWPAGRPRWIPPTFDWVVGCSYLGLPESTGVVRNPIGANMSMRTDRARAVGGFDGSVGRVGSRPRGCEETELAIRLTATTPGAVVLYVPEAAVDHHVSADRIRVGYFLRRCWHEGVSKAEVVRLAGATAGLERERRHVAAVIPAAIARDARSVVTGDAAAAARACMAVGGLGAAAGGYLIRRVKLAALRARTRKVMARSALIPAGPAPQAHAE